jgi:hypothetical protein
MGNPLTSIRISRVLLLLFIVFLSVDTVPHPSLGPGLIEGFIQQEQEQQAIERLLSHLFQF